MAEQLDPSLASSGAIQSIRGIVCKATPHWTQWKCALWRDKSRLSGLESNWRVRVLQLTLEQHVSDCIVSTRRFGAAGIRECGCYSEGGLSPLDQRN